MPLMSVPSNLLSCEVQIFITIKYNILNKVLLLLYFEIALLPKSKRTFYACLCKVGHATPQESSNQRLTGFTISFAFFDEQDVKMLLSQLFNCEFVNRFRYVIRMQTAIQWIAMVVAILYLFVQYRRAKNTVWRRRKAIQHYQVLKDIGCFKWVPLRLYSKVPSRKYLCGRNKQQMAFKKIFAVRRDPPLNRIMEQMKPVKISRMNRIVPTKEVKLLTIYL
ncbi:hypothetical protein T06_2813 [Trichinella sp. T6]|nr:hypothetical protein T06_2813 [Trichinella sp. T6]